MSRYIKIIAKTAVWKIYIIVLLVSPFFWFSAFHIGGYVRAWKSAPGRILQKGSSIFALYNVRYSTELVWESPDNINNRTLSSRIYYNKGSVLISEFFNILERLSPGHYFVDNDAIIILFVPFWFIAVAESISERKIYIFLLALASVLPAYLVDQTNLYFIFPTCLVYCYFVSLGVVSFCKKFSFIKDD